MSDSLRKSKFKLVAKPIAAQDCIDMNKFVAILGQHHQVEKIIYTDSDCCMFIPRDESKNDNNFIQLLQKDLDAALKKQKAENHG